jgi:hypothetical protein
VLAHKFAASPSPFMILLGKHKLTVLIYIIILTLYKHIVKSNSCPSDLITLVITPIPVGTKTKVNPGAFPSTLGNFPLQVKYLSYCSLLRVKAIATSGIPKCSFMSILQI